MSTFEALRIYVTDQGVERKLETCDLDALPEGEVLIKVSFSSLNYKDALSANGHTGITRQYPHTPGIDASGTVVLDQTGRFTEGAPVVVIGFDLGMNTWGGFGHYIRVPANWVLPLPDGLSLAEAMQLGTAGVTAGYAVEQLLLNGLEGKNGPVLVTGATGGVGSIAVHLLASLGFEVAASTGKPDSHDWLRSLGAKHIVDRHTLSEPSKKALLPETYQAAIDTVGDSTLVNILKLLKFGGSVAACGIVGGTAVPADIYPFILRGVKLIGIASADAPLSDRQRVLTKFSRAWRLPMLDDLTETVPLVDVSARIDQMLAGKIQRRALVTIDG